MNFPHIRWGPRELPPPSLHPQLRGRRVAAIFHRAVSASPSFIQRVATSISINGRKIHLVSSPALATGARETVTTNTRSVVVRFTTENGLADGPPSLKSMSDRDLAKALKIIQVVRGSFQGVVDVCIENDVAGSFLLTLTKANGLFRFTVKDSKNCSEKAISAHLNLLIHMNTDEFSTLAYQKTGEEISRWAKEIGGKSAQAKARQKELLAKATEENRETVEKVLLGAQFIRESGWLTSHDLDLQDHVSDVRKLLLFLKENLSSTHPDYQKVCGILRFFQGRGVKIDFVKHAFSTIERDSREGGCIAEGTKREMLLTSKLIKKLWDHRLEISHINDLEKRHKFLNEQLQVADEAAVIKSRKPEEIVFQFLKTYLLAKRAKKLYLFDGLKRGPCLTGRMRVIEEAAGLLVGIQPADDTLPQHVKIFPITMLMNVFLEKVEDMNEGAARQHLNSLKTSYFRENAEFSSELIEQCQLYGKSEGATTFIQFLKEKGLIPQNDNPIDWAQVVPRFIRSIYFADIKAEAIEATADSLPKE